MAKAAEAVEAAIAGEAKLDARRLRADFPIFEQRVHGKPLAYLDSAVSAQKPRQVLDALREFYETSYTNVHRGVYLLAERATERFESSREKVRAFVNAASTREIVFTRSATEALNLVAYAWGLDNLGPGDVVVATELEHHSNFVPWQQIAKRTGAQFRPIPVDGRGELRLDALDAIAKQGGVKVVANSLVSNALGTINPVDKLAAWAHEQGAIMVVDAAQAAPHRRIDVQKLGCDFLAFSSGANRNDHKLLKGTLDSIPIERPEPTAEQPQGISLDRAYDNADSREFVDAYGLTPHIRSRGEEIDLKASRPGWRARRWVVEACHSWLNRNRAILIRWSKKDENHLALLQLASGLIAFKKAHAARLALAQAG